MSRAMHLRRSAALVAAAVVLAALLSPMATPPAGADWGAVTAEQADAQRRIALGAQHTCVVLDDGHVQCWGANDDGQLGTGTTKTSTRPHTVLGISTAVAVAAGQRHSCALLLRGSVKCWGLDGSGQIGDGLVSIAPVTTPAGVVNLTDATAIATGAVSSCALRTNGRVVCWGHDGSGQLGNGDPAGETGTSATPVGVTGITTATAIAAGDYHACALLTDRSIRCWGSSGQGRLGNGVTNADSTSPVAVTGFPDGTELVAIAAGGQHTCALDNDGFAWCWGDDTEGQLGDARSRKTQTPPPFAANPVKVHKIADDDPKAIVITAGGLHTCALLVDRTARCWGSGARSQLAVSPAPDHGEPVSEPRPVSASAGLDDPLTGIAALVVGGYHSCALRDSALRCWGYDFTGQLGLRRGMAETPVQTTAVLGATAVTVGNQFACALHIPPGGDDAPNAPRVPECWGDGTFGQLGSAVPDLRSDVPVVVPGLADVVQIESGNGTTCALPRNSGSPQCWGRGTDGQLGDGTNVNRTAPGPVTITDVTQVSVGGHLFDGAERVTACARTSTERARCWGYGEQGQLGNNDVESQTTPVTVRRLDDSTDPPSFPILTSVSGVAAGGDHACATAGDAVWCWGENGVGQLGNESNEDSPVGVQVKDLSGVTQLAAGRGHTCAITGDEVKCWGRGAAGQLGNGSSSNRNIPVTVSLPDPGSSDNGAPIAITAGDDHTCALLAEGDVYCWGQDSSGQVGNGAADGGSTPKRAVNSPDDAVLVVGISAGRFNTCATYVDMSVWCWGDNSRDQIGDGVGNAWPWPEVLQSVADTVGENHLPTPAADAATTAPGTSVDIDVLANDSDPDVTDSISVVFVSDPPKGTATFSAGTVTYTPDADACDTGPIDTFEYAVRDTYGGTVLAAVSITITCPNKLPVAVNDAVAAIEDTAAQLTVLANDSDADGDTVTVTSNDAPAHGTVALATDGTGTYTPAADYCGPDAFSYLIGDGRGGAATAVVSITVACRQDNPVAADDAAATTEDDEVTVEVLANDVDVDGDALSVTAVGLPAHGVATVDAGNRIHYTPAPDYCGNDEFTYAITDGGRLATAKVTVTVNCSPDAPRAVDDTGTTDEDTSFVVDVLANDTDPDGDALTVINVTAAAHGAVEIVPGGVRYTPEANFCGADGFGYTIRDGDGNTSTAVSNAVAVRCVQDAPVPVADSMNASEDSQATFDVLGNDSDPDGDALAVTEVTAPTYGVASVVAAGVRYIPADNYCGPDTLTYTVSDGNGNTATAVVSIDVTCVQDAPALAAVQPQTTPWGDVLLVALSANDADGDTLTYSLVGAPDGATVDDAGVVRWEPNDSQVGTRTLTASVSDGGRSTQRAFEVKVTRRATATAWTGASAGVWSDTVSVSALLTDAVTGSGVGGRSVAFKIGAGTPSAATTDAGVASAAPVLRDAVGATTASATFAGDEAWAPSQATVPFIVHKESSTVRVGRGHLTLTSGGVADVTLGATVTEDPDGRLGGGLATTRVVFTAVPGGQTCTASMSATVPGAASGTCKVTGVPLGSSAVVAVLDAAAYTSPADVTALAVAAPVSGGGAGGGEVGQGLQRPAFAFTAKTNRKAGPSGDAVQVWRTTADLGSGPRDYALIARGTTLSALSSSCEGKTKACTVSVSVSGATTTAVDLTTGGLLSLSGTSAFTLWATDAAEPAGDAVPPDRYAVSITGAWPFALGARTDQKLLTAGNVRVP